jgi:hypothetical protein
MIVAQTPWLTRRANQQHISIIAKRNESPLRTRLAGFLLECGLSGR